jgi:hypothetical protein
MKRILLAIGLIGIMSGLTAQNEFEIVSILEPSFGTNYRIDDSINVEVRMRNVGPNVILASDKIEFDVKITNPDTSIFFNVEKFATTTLDTGDVAIYTLLTDYQLNTQNNYQVCISVAGSTTYPLNTSKEPPACVSFPVSLQERVLKANKLYFVEGLLRFELDKAPQRARYRILDLSGKVLKSGNLISERTQQLNFQAPAKGLYFLQLQNNEAKPSTQKFIVR